jgi:hypothetical protein
MARLLLHCRTRLRRDRARGARRVMFCYTAGHGRVEIGRKGLDASSVEAQFVGTQSSNIRRSSTSDRDPGRYRS